MTQTAEQLKEQALTNYFKRVAFCNDKHGAYVESRDQVNCKDHGWSAYDLFYYKTAENKDVWMRVCSRCAQMTFPESKAAVLAPEKTIVICSEIDCTERAVKGKVCIHCHGKFCNDHMPGKDFCNACSEELEDNASATEFHAC